MRVSQPSGGRSPSSPSAKGKTPSQQTMHSAGEYFPPCWQLLSIKTLEAWPRRENKRRKEDSLCIQCIFSSLGSAVCLQWSSKATRVSPPLQRTPGCCCLPADSSHEIQSSPGCYATPGPPGQLRSVFEGNLSTQ